jgi:hypothetical protein
MENSVSSKAKVGRVLPESAQVIVPAGSVLTLICNQASLITLNKGTVLSALNAQCSTSKQSVSSNYLRFVWNQLTNKPGTPEKNRKLFMTNEGSVSRGINNVWIDPRLDTIKYVAGNFPLSWKSFAEAESFNFSIFTEPQQGTKVYSTNTKNRSIDVKQFAGKLEKGVTYYWTASVEGEEGVDRKAFHLATNSEYKAIL